MVNLPPPISDHCRCVVKDVRRRLIHGWGQQWCGQCKRAIKWGMADFNPMQRTDGRE